MTDDVANKAEIKTAEGWGASVYKDSRGYDTLGWGFLVDKGQGGSIPVEVAEFWLDFLYRPILEACRQYPWFDSASQVTQTIFVALMYNMGAHRLAGFHKMLAALATQSYVAAAAELQDSAWFTQVGHRGPRYVNSLKDQVLYPNA